MNWFQKLLNNPNVHLLGSLITGGLSIAFPAFAVPLQIVAGTLVGTGALLPGNGALSGTTPIATPVVVTPAPPIVTTTPQGTTVNIPAASAGGSYHAIDYATLAANLLAQLAPKPVDGAGRS